MTTPPPPPPQVPSNSGSSDDKTMALIAHFGIAIFGFLPPLIIYLVKGDSPWVKNEAAKAFNFTIVATAAYAAAFVLNIVSAVADIGIIGCFTCLLYIAAFLMNIIFGVINGIKVNNGEETKYPFEIPILK